MSLLNLKSKSVIAISIIRKMSSCLKVEKRKLVLEVISWKTVLRTEAELPE